MKSTININQKKKSRIQNNVRKFLATLVFLTDSKDVEAAMASLQIALTCLNISYLSIHEAPMLNSTNDNEDNLPIEIAKKKRKDKANYDAMWNKI